MHKRDILNFIAYLHYFFIYKIYEVVHPLPFINVKLLTRIQLRTVYLQIPVTESLKHNTSFHCRSINGMEKKMPLLQLIIFRVYLQTL